MMEYYLPGVLNEEYLDGFIAEYFTVKVNKRVLKQGIILLLDYCSQKYLSRESEEYGIRLNSKSFLRGMINHRHAKRVIQCLKTRNVLKLKRDYFAGHHSKTYEFCEWVIKGGFAKHSNLAIKKRSFYAREDRYDTEKLLQDTNILIRSTTANLLKLEMPGPNHVEFAALSGTERCCRRYALERFEDRRIYCFLDRFGRLHSNFTNLPKDLRVLSLHEAKPIYYLDIKSCFPTLLLTFAENPHEKAKYLDWIHSGQFYENLMRRTGIEVEFRATFKKEFNAWINGGNQPDIHHAMRAEFPMLFSTICRMKQKEYRHVGYSLMRLEAKLMLGITLTRFWEKCPDGFAISLHDAIYTTEQSCAHFEYLITAAFETHVGVVPCMEKVLNVPEQKVLPLAA